MKPMIKISVAMVCALGMSAAAAQSVQRDGVVVSGANAPQTLVQTSTAAPIQTAQAPTGGAASGASAGGAAAGAGLGTTLVVVGAAVAAIAVASDSGSTVTH